MRTLLVTAMYEESGKLQILSPRRFTGASAQRAPASAGRPPSGWNDLLVALASQAVATPHNE